MRARVPKKQAYHHGDLGNAALAEVLVVLSERGARGVTFAEVARRLGVTAAALYRHYADPQALLAAAAVESFELFATVLRAAKASTPHERLLVMADAYLAFALKHPARYELMFGLRMEGGKPESLERAGSAAFSVLTDAISAYRPDATERVVNDIAEQVWAICHGFASLVGNGIMAADKREAQALLAEAIRLIVEGAASDAY
jgi:AcrR family transcriptional regulator